MFKLILALSLVLLCGACAQASSVTDATEATIQNVDLPATQIVPSNTPRWVETRTSGVEVGTWMPPGWQVDTTNGLMMVEHMTPLQGGEMSHGITFRVFVPDVDALISSEVAHENLAHAVLDAVTKRSNLTQGAHVSEPVAFDVDNHSAAYYLFASPDDIYGLVLALAMDSERKIVVVNAAAPRSETERLRELLPVLLSDLRINRQRLTAALLEALPETWDFPAVPVSN